jgi:glycosyltransferase involved in cell wall biosynthesis
MMNLLHIIPTYKPAYIYGGTITSISLLCENLATKGNCNVTVLSTTANGKEELPVHKHTPKKVDGVDVYYFPRWTKDHSQLSPALLWFLLKNARRFEVIHIHSWWNLSVMLATFICILRGVKPILSPRGMLSSFTIKGRFKPLFHRFVGKYLLKNTYLHATSAQEAKECLTLIPDWSHTNLPNLLDTPLMDFLPQKIKLNNHNSLENKPFQLLFLSRLHEKKGVELLFEALAKVPFDWSLNIAGGGEIDYLKQLKTHSKNLRIDLKINWLGWVNAQERTSVFETADLLVLPSHNENFANVVIESLATGTPVLVSQYVGLSDYVAEKKLGWVCDTTVDSIREKLIESYTQAAQRVHIAAHSSAHIHRDFDPSVLIEKYVKMYQKISPKPSNKKILQTETHAITE